MAKQTTSIERFAYITRGAYAGRRARIDYDQGSNVWVSVMGHTLNLPEGWFIRLTATTWEQPIDYSPIPEGKLWRWEAGK